MQLKTLLGAALLLLAGATQAQTIPETTPEPEFIGEIVTVRPDGTVAKLEKQSVQMRTRANASAVIFGIGKAKTKLIIEGPKAGVRLTAGQPASFIVRAVDNATDPMSIINVFRFEAKKDKRMAEMASVSSFGSVKSNLERLSFTGRKFGETIPDHPRRDSRRRIRYHGLQPEQPRRETGHRIDLCDRLSLSRTFRRSTAADCPLPYLFSPHIPPAPAEAATD